jgi:hypothetical protein
LRTGGTEHDSVADRVAFRKKSTGEGVVDDRDAWGVEFVGRRENAAGLGGDLKRTEIIEADRLRMRDLRNGAAGAIGPAFDRERIATAGVLAAGDGKTADRAYGDYAGERLEPLRDFGEEGGIARAIGTALSSAREPV